jgi:hypothetical protein
MFLRQRYSAMRGGLSMNKITSLATIAGALLACGLSTALANRTWVSGHGTDSGACTLALPCRTFAFALTQTAAPGEIDVLDPGAFGKVTITSSISIVNDGVGVAAIGIAAGNAITINAGPSDSVHLRGLTIEGISGTTNGILFNFGLSLTIENCVIRGFVSGVGIFISPSTSSSFSVSNTIASDNRIVGVGIFIQPTGAAVVTGVLSNVTANNNENGIVVRGSLTTGASLKVTIVDSEASNNTGSGVEVLSAAGQAATAVMLRNVVASNNLIGLDAGGAILRVAHSVVTGTTTGVTGSFGELISYGDNDIDGNITDNTGVLTVIPTH